MFAKIPKEKRDEILAKARAGEKVVSLASQYGISDKTIYGWLRVDSNDDVVSLLKYNKLKRENEELKWLIGELTLDLKRKKKIELLANEIRQAHVVHTAYGQKRMAIHLKVNHKRTERVMRLCKIEAPRKRSKHYYCTVSTSNHHYTNLIQKIPQADINPHHIWVCDTSYFKYRGRFWYLVTIMDMATRQILGGWVGRHHNAAHVLSCVKQAIMSAGCLPKYFHTDQGKEFMAQVLTQYLELQGVTVSVSDKASPWQNGYKESFFGRFKEEFGDINRFETDGQLIEEIYARIHYYNYNRIHTALKMPPAIYAQLISENLSQKRGT